MTPPRSCMLFDYIPMDLLLLMTMEITLLFALVGLIWFLIAGINPSSSLKRAIETERRKYNCGTDRRKTNTAE